MYDRPGCQCGIDPFASFPQSLPIHLETALCDIFAVRPSAVLTASMVMVADSGLSRWSLTSTLRWREPPSGDA